MSEVETNFSKQVASNKRHSTVNVHLLPTTGLSTKFEEQKCKCKIQMKSRNSKLFDGTGVENINNVNNASIKS